MGVRHQLAHNSDHNHKNLLSAGFVVLLASVPVYAPSFGCFAMKYTSCALLTLVASTKAFAPSAFTRQRQQYSSSSASSVLGAVSKKDSYSITLLPGDGIGPEITEATKGVLEAVGKRFDFEMDLKEALIGGAAIDAVSDPFPQESLDQCKSSDSVLLACIGGYKVRACWCVLFLLLMQCVAKTCVLSYTVHSPHCSLVLLFVLIFITNNNNDIYIPTTLTQTQT